MPSNPGCARSERGIALVMALLVILVVTLLAAVLMMNINIEGKITGHSLRETEALNTADAGVGEALSRIRNLEGPNDPNNPRLVTQVFNCLAGSVPVLGADSTALPTGQPAGLWLNYSTATKGPDVLTIAYKTDPARTVVYRYDNTLNPPAGPENTVSGMPIFVVNSVGRDGSARRKITSEVIQKPFNVNIHGAVAAAVDIKFSGNVVVCGYNHRADTPTNTGNIGRFGVGGCDENAGISHWEINSGDKTGCWTTGNIQNTGTAQDFGTPAEQQGQTGFYTGPWDALGMTQAAFWSWVGSAHSTEPPNPNGIYYLDNNGTSQDQSGTFAYNGGTGSGFMYVDGDLTLNSTFSYRGLIYVEGDLKLNGSAWILGAIIVRGHAELKNVNGGATVLYSYDSIQQNLSRYGGQFVTLSWKESN